MIHNLKISETPPLNDSRGCFYEVQRGHLKQVSISKSKPNVVRGMHCSFYGKIVSCISGKILDVTVDLREDSPTFKKVFYQELSEFNNLKIEIPPGVAHGFYSYTDSTVLYLQENEYDKAFDVEVNCYSPQLEINWPVPQSMAIMSEKDTNSPFYIGRKENPEFLILGSTGYIGKEVVKTFLNEGVSYYNSKVRIENFLDLCLELEKVSPRYVINCAGIAGKPNIDWCEDNKEETIFFNVTSQLNVVEACRKYNVKCVLFGTGVIFDSPNGQVFDQNDTPNFSNNFYTEQRIVLEKLISNYSNVLNLRILYPICSDLENKKNLINKIITYGKGTVEKCSYTVLPDVLPEIIRLCKSKVSGNINLCNHGTISNFEILNLLKKVFNIKKDFQSCQRSFTRSFPILTPSVLSPDITFSFQKILKEFRPYALVFGASGMLGRYVSKYLQKQGKIVVEISRNDFEIKTEFKQVKNLFLKYQPKTVINCAGIINKRNDISLKETFIVNSMFPHVLAKECKELNINLIHPSTDCVFSGEKGGYTEFDQSDESESYGASKYLGEVGTCIRCSIIGYDPKGMSLLSWVLSKNNEPIEGFVNHYWNGITCLEYAKLVFYIIENNLFWKGVRHLGMEKKINKFNLILKIIEIYNLNIILKKKISIFTDRSLKVNNFYSFPSLEEQLLEMKEFDRFNSPPFF